MNRLMVTLAGLLAAASMAAAAPLEMSHVAGDAHWVAHLDVRAILNSQLGRFALARIRQQEPNLDAKLAAFRELFGLDPLTDVHDLTLYGPALGEEQGVLILHARLDREKLLTLLRANDTFRELRHGNHAYYRWTDPPKGDEPAKTQFGSFYGNDLAVISSQQEMVEHALDVLDGTAPSQAGRWSFPALKDTGPGAFVLAAGRNLNQAAQRERDAAVLKNIRTVSLRAGERAGQAFLRLDVEATTDEAATDIRKVIDGAVALGRILQQHEDLAPFRRLGGEARVGGGGRFATLEASAPGESVVRVLEILAERERRERAAAREDND